MVTPLSSRKIKSSGAIEPVFARNSSRRLMFSSLSRSWAWSDFFTPHAHLTKQLSDAAFRNRHAVGGQTMTHFLIGRVGLLAQPRAQQLTLFGADATQKAVPLLAHACGLPGTQLPAANLLCPTPTDAKLAGQPAKVAGPGSIGMEKLTAQIIGIRLWHRSSLRRSPIPICAYWPLPGYSKFGPALKKERVHAVHPLNGYRRLPIPRS